MSFDRKGENFLESDPQVQKRIEAFLGKMAKKFSIESEIIEDIVREYIRMRPLPPRTEMKEWEKLFLKEKKEHIQKEIIISEVSVECGIPIEVIKEIILSTFLEEYPFPSLRSGQEEWRDFLVMVCAERMDELQERTRELIAEREPSEEE